jgi:ABC-type glutathione transport system ATPase component
VRDLRVHFPIRSGILQRTVGHVRAVDGVGFELAAGRTLALVGESGCGKTTVGKAILQLLVPSSGSVSFDGQDLSFMNRQQELAFRKEAAMVFQDSALWANQNLYQILELPLRLHYPDMKKSERDQRMNDILGRVGYKRQLTLRPAQLSMGEQKLIAFARAMLCNPNLLFLDEWTESLDDASSQRLINLVKEQRQKGNTMIFVSHDFKAIKYLADYIVMIVGGQFSKLFTGEQLDSDDDLAQHIEKGIAL